MNEKVKNKQQQRLDKLKTDIADTIRYHEAGWKKRYYDDKFKVHTHKRHTQRSEIHTQRER